MRKLRQLKKLSHGRPRQGGERVVYDQAATDHYKSREVRLGKAQELLGKFGSEVLEQPIDARTTLYYFLSERSPWGYWTVGVVREQEDPTLPPPRRPGTPPATPPNGVEQTTPANLYALHIPPTGISTPGYPPGFDCRALPRNVGLLSFLYPQFETYTGTLTVTGVGNPSIVATSPLVGLSLSMVEETDGVVWFRHSKFYELDGNPHIVFLITRWGGEPPPLPLTYDDDVTWFFDPLPYDEFEILSPRPTPSGIGTATQVVNDAPPPPPPLGDPTPLDPPPPLPLQDPPNFEFSCDCPDSIKYEYPDAESPYPSRQYAREWVASEAGAENGICKHIMAAMLHIGLPIP
jgi:hypothetical protein